ncbi:hypothetical protein F2P81_019132 [Scophthalmus maximus]|uniref:Uncharacterized protein n=1 Tax=Scophthalmus maximus TaxID=52904 RepID=A0A6A4S6Z6_SCOMX|nr:hypothetical protein F2P81_019132 [Scophthalmus maximus]
MCSSKGPGGAAAAAAADKDASLPFVLELAQALTSPLSIRRGEEWHGEPPSKCEELDLGGLEHLYRATESVLILLEKAEQKLMISTAHKNCPPHENNKFSTYGVH